ncbi:hypothetical protein EM858_04190 [Agrobacterium sp. CNPSo 2736]|uniref:hypothetical protein n=1 Tax=Agrobacterium sp. CNPSo 2736 TaxID=2499627 RepID=UPI000FDC5180|nr:hypothetical protein [Agrobacterium sp. CNPSo 2736]RVT80202.1 hypothetical protein EM858_04190 [Agrobacterium sp. CNPSo 2736]
MNKLALFLPIAFLIGCGTDNTRETTYTTPSANKPTMEANLSDDEPYQGQYVRSFGETTYQSAPPSEGSEVDCPPGATVCTAL